jgi:large subunit ribosomal protein LX
MVISVASPASNKVKVFRVSGEIDKPNYQTSFRKEVRALKPEHAVEEVYKQLGSRHRAKRFQIKILGVEEVNPQDIKDTIIRKLTMGEE